MEALRDEVRSRWQAVIDGELAARDAAEWADEWVAKYDEEVTFRGLMCLIDLCQVEWQHPDERARATQFRRYWDWMEMLAQYDENPRAWNRAYAIGAIRGLNGHLRSERVAAAAASYVQDGFIAADEVEALLAELGSHN
jgi:hypothetical protein